MDETQARRIVRARSNGRCELCATTRATNWSHRRARGQGGLWTPSNGLDLCGSGNTGCHGWLEANSKLADAGGWRIVHRNPPPAIVPCWLNTVSGGVGWWLLDDSGVFFAVDDDDLPTHPIAPEWAQLL